MVPYNRYTDLPVFNSIKMDFYQASCIQSINDNLGTNNKCYIENYCGSGKSIIALYKLCSL